MDVGKRIEPHKFGVFSISVSRLLNCMWLNSSFLVAIVLCYWASTASNKFYQSKRSWFFVGIDKGGTLENQVLSQIFCEGLRFFGWLNYYLRLKFFDLCWTFEMAGSDDELNHNEREYEEAGNSFGKNKVSKYKNNAQAS